MKVRLPFGILIVGEKIGKNRRINGIINNLLMQNSNNVRDALFPDCPIRNILSRVGDKWSLLVLNTLQNAEEPMRFNALQRALPDISQKVLTATLRTLEEDGFLVRTVYAEVPPRVDYRLTERALSFMQACNPMIQWAKDNLETILSDRGHHTTR